MKNGTFSTFSTSQISSEQIKETRLRSATSGLSAFVAAMALATCAGHASNILVNPSFENDHTSARIVPAGWTYFAPPGAPSPGDYWIEHNVPAHSGTYFWKQWNAIYNGVDNVAGIYEDFSSAPGSSTAS